jgi:hypothetical protein
VRVDARCEWLCVSAVKQAENLWVNQLLHSKDVVAQTEAVTGVCVCLLPDFILVRLSLDTRLYARAIMRTQKHDTGIHTHAHITYMCAHIHSAVLGTLLDYKIVHTSFALLLRILGQSLHAHCKINSSNLPVLPTSLKLVLCTPSWLSCPAFSSVCLQQYCTQKGEQCSHTQQCEQCSHTQQCSLTQKGEQCSLTQQCSHTQKGE